MAHCIRKSKNRGYLFAIKKYLSYKGQCMCKCRICRTKPNIDATASNTPCIRQRLHSSPEPRNWTSIFRATTFINMKEETKPIHAGTRGTLWSGLDKEYSGAALIYREVAWIGSPAPPLYPRIPLAPNCIHCFKKFICWVPLYFQSTIMTPIIMKWIMPLHVVVLYILCSAQLPLAQASGQLTIYVCITALVRESSYILD